MSINNINICYRHFPKYLEPYIPYPNLAIGRTFKMYKYKSLGILLIQQEALVKPLL